MKFSPSLKFTPLSSDLIIEDHNLALVHLLEHAFIEVITSSSLQFFFQTWFLCQGWGLGLTGGDCEGFFNLLILLKGQKIHHFLLGLICKSSLHPHLLHCTQDGPTLTTHYNLL